MKAKLKLLDVLTRRLRKAGQHQATINLHTKAPDCQGLRERIARCDRSLQLYRNGNGHDDIVDLLSDALLWCDEHRVSFDGALKTARMRQHNDSTDEGVAP